MTGIFEWCRAVQQSKPRCNAAKNAVVRALGEKGPMSFPQRVAETDPGPPACLPRCEGPSRAPEAGEHVRFMARVASFETSTKVITDIAVLAAESGRIGKR